MKKTLAALAVLGAFAGSAVAADVTLYGLVDYGFNYQHNDLDQPNVDATDNFEMRSGMNSGSRFGLKGTEDLGNGYKIGFVLENGFDADTGSLGNGGRIFGRESQVYIQGAWGTLSFGRVGQLASANGSYSLLGKASPFSGGWGDSVGQKFVMATGFDRYDNTVTYVTPDFAGFKVHAQYSFKNNGKDGAGDEGKSSADRYYAIGATYESQNLYVVGIVDSINYSDGNQWIAGSTNPTDDQITATLGAAYDFGFMKLYGEGQYFKHASAVGASVVNAKKVGYTLGEDNGWEGYGLILAASTPVLGGTAKAQLGYLDAEGCNTSDIELSRWNVSVGYDYALSKRTSVYTAAAYMRDDIQYGKDADSFNPSSVEVMAGLIHKF